MRFFLLLWILLSGYFLAAQNKQTITTRVGHAPKLDGVLDDEAWKGVAEAGDFITNQPSFGKAASQRTSVKVVYDHYAIYIAAQLYDDPTAVRRQLTARDQHNRADADHFAIFIDTYKDRQNGFQFLVTSRNVQSDARLSANFSGDWGNYGDVSWDAVWDSRVAMNKEGWSVEMKIPYSAIRFSKDSLQSWGIQFLRFSRAHNETSFWNPVNPAVNGFVNQFGDLEGLKDLAPPLRLSFSPYISGGYRSNPPDPSGNRQQEWLKSGGMDLKWGVNESFTLDATLVPDFGQVISDNKVNNLTPFDIQFQENRPFFTEGTELFNKADIFYSRRVGRTPAGYSGVDALADNGKYSVVKNPSVTPLYNAIKFSGRNKHNLGIGVFNAVTRPVNAIIRNQSSGRDSLIRTEEMANYNIVVLDKALQNRSYISFTNTNVLRNGSAADANVTALDLGLYTKDNRHALFLKPRYSRITGPDGYDGWANYASFGKVSGQWQWNLGSSVESDRYNTNDMGFLLAPNEITTEGSISYNVFTPTIRFLQQRYKLYAEQTNLYKPYGFQSVQIKASAFWWFKNFWDMTAELVLNPVKYYDYFELRSNYKKLMRPSWFYVGLSGSTDSRKRLYGYWNIGFAESKDVYNDMYYRLNNGIRYRFSQRFSAELSNNLQSDNGQVGYAFEREANGEPIAALRKVYDVATVLSGIYNFTPRMNMTFRGRHYWSKVTNRKFFTVDGDGNWIDRPFLNGRDQNVNIFNVDVFYVWDFRLGSRIVAGWKNWVDPQSTNDIKTHPGYTQNLNQVFNMGHGNEFTIRFIYFLDYQDLRKKQPLL
ncbi:hypothetical protein BC349_04625 [Flavihumibacter stibioxidans]|uniref:Hydrolase n=2 Tax=Flavihumibacter stibioxidans TaxID=1834163 RepID=A0ABR7M6J7_9BACT|nr:hypothetical protein [Flavihumibacter stibioxidans]